MNNFLLIVCLLSGGFGIASLSDNQTFPIGDDDGRSAVLRQLSGSSQSFVITPSSLFGISAPLQCLGGTFCGLRAGSPSGSGLCPPGYSCPSGSTAPVLAPLGQFVGGAGSVQAYNCSSNTFAPSQGSGVCLPCPPGYSCINPGTVTPSICAPGTYRFSVGSASAAGSTANIQVAISNSVSCSSCPAGTFSFLRGAPNVFNCEPCPAGRVCPGKTANITLSDACSEGFICAEGTSLEIAGSYACGAGFVCSKGSTPVSVYSSLCPKGYVCDIKTTRANQFRTRCPVGFYCPRGTPWSTIMLHTQQPRIGYLSRGQFYVLQIAGQYCLRQYMLQYKAAAVKANSASIQTGKGPLTADQTALIVSNWTNHVSECIQTQSSFLTKLNKQNVPVSGSIAGDLAWHVAQLLSATYVGKRLDQFSNKCDANQFPRVDGPNTAWDCMCTQSFKDGSLMQCLTNTEESVLANGGEPRVGAPYNFTDLNTVDSEVVCTNLDLAWPDCLDWARTNNFITPMSPSEKTYANALVSGRSDNLAGSDPSNLRLLAEGGSSGVTSASGPSTGGVYDDFDAMSLPFMDYLSAALMRNFLRFAAAASNNAGNSGTSFTQCPFGTLTITDGVESIEGCVPRILIPSVNDPDKIVVARINPINVGLTNVDPVYGFPKKFEEDQRMVFNIPARSLATLTFDYRTLGTDFKYGLDWRIVFLINNKLAPDEDIPQQCYAILNGFVNYQYAISLDATLRNLYTGAARQMNLDKSGCSLVMNPTPFEAFAYASSSTLCPQGSPECHLRTLNTKTQVEQCNSAKRPINVHEFYIHPSVDIQLRIEIQILNGVYLPDRFRLLKSVNLEVSEPSRASLGTSKAFVVIYPSSLAQYVFPAYNLPLVPLTKAERESYGNKNPGYVSGIPAVSQQGTLTKASVSWLPRDSAQVPLANCMRNPKLWEEFLYSNDGYFGNYNPRSEVFMTHLPFLSNCRGYGSTIPVWHVTEKSPSCENLSPEATKPISEFSFGADSYGDSCSDGIGNSATVQIECMVDEVLNDKKSTPRWFELQTGSIMYYMTANALSAEEYANLTFSTTGKLIPVVLVQANPFDGTWMTSVSLELGYWQSSSDTKILAEASITFGNFQPLTDAQARGTEPWTYTLQVSWYPLAYIDAFNVYAFPVWLYALIPAVIGLFIWIMMGFNWLFHYWAAGDMKAYAAKLTDKRYWRLVFQAMSKGYILAAIPCLIIFFVLVIALIGETNFFTVSLFTCDDTDPYGCRVSLLDPLPSSWSGESLSNPHSYRSRRLGRTGTLLVVIGSYMILSAMRGFFPNLSAHYYDAERNKSEEEKEAERSWPPEQESFSPLIWKRSTYFLLIGGVCIMFQLIIQFSYSTYTSWGWWKYMFLFYAIMKLTGWVTIGLVNEEILKIPIIAASQANLELTAIGSFNCFTYITTAFLMNAIYMIDRLYIVPNEAKFVASAQRKFKRWYRNASKIFSGGKSAEGQDLNSDTLNEGDENDMGSGGTNPGDAGSVTTSLAVPNNTTARSTSSADAAGMMRFLSCFVSSQLTTFFGLLQFFFSVVFYDSTQSMNYQNVPYSTSLYYVLLHVILLPFRYLLDVLVLNTAELYHGWRILDYLEYCRYRFVVRPNKWKGVGEIADELIEPDLRSLDLYCFSSQLYFISFIICFGAVLLSCGLQVLINNAWDLFTDQATPFIVIGGILCMFVIEGACKITADYLGIWATKKQMEDAAVVDGTPEGGDGAPEAANDKEDEYEKIIAVGGETGGAFGNAKQLRFRAPVGSVLYNWPEPSPGDKAGWDRYRAAYLKENQLWLQAHMDTLIDSQTTIDYRRKLMDSLAKVLKESNLIDIQKQQQKALRTTAGVVGDAEVNSTSRSTGRESEFGGSAGGHSSSLERALEISAVPMHETVVAELASSREQYRGTAIELATQTLLDRGRFVRFLAESVAGLELAQATHLLDFCETCGADPSAHLAIIPQYPVSYMADQFRIQRGYPDTWNVPLWQQYYHQFTPVCTICELCREHYAKTDRPIQIGEFMGAAGRGRMSGHDDEAIVPCEQVLRTTNIPLPRRPLSVEATTALNHWLEFADVVSDPRSSNNQLDSALIRAGYKLTTAPIFGPLSRGPEIPRNPFANIRVDVSPTGRAMLLEWLARARR